MGRRLTMCMQARHGRRLYYSLTRLEHSGEGKSPQWEGLWEVHLGVHSAWKENGPRLEHM